MEKILFAIVILLIVILIVLIGVVGYLLLKYLKLQEQRQARPNHGVSSYEDKMPKEVKEQIEKARSQKQLDSVHGQFCVDHPENMAKGKCSISGEPYCELCITKEKDVRIARKYLHLFLDNTWENIFFIEDEILGEEKLAKLMDLKKEIWSNDGTPIITQKQFKINVETDMIETFTVVMARPEDSEMVKSKFSFLTD